MLDISIPCEQCGGPIGFGLKKCGKCGTAPSRDARAALRARLMASSDEFRELDQHIGSASIVLMLIALLHFAYGSIAFVVSQRVPVVTAADMTEAGTLLAQNLAIAIVFLACWGFARGFPAAAIAVAISFWLFLQVGAMMLSPTAIFVGLWVKAVVLILLVRGAIAGIRAARYLSKLRPPAA
jgi:hypothetical protein